MRRRSLAAVTALALGAGGSLLIATPAMAADAGHVDIRVELDLVHGNGDPYGSGPAVFEVTNAAITDGPELTGANLVDNPSGWCGSLQVDVDPAAKTITVSPDHSCDFTDVKLWVSSPEFGSVILVSDELLWPEDEGEGEGPEEGPLEDQVPVLARGGSGGTVLSAARIVPMAAPGSLAALDWAFAAPQLTASWHVDQTGAGDDINTEDLGGAAVFSYGAATPGPTPPAKVSTAANSGIGGTWIGAAGLAVLGAVAAAGVLALRSRRAE